MIGWAEAPGAGTVLNAMANGVGSAFAIDLTTRATVHLDQSGEASGQIDGEPDADTALIERCLTLATERYGDGEGGTVKTESDIPMAAGLKSSSAAANATVLATLDALGAADAVDPLDAARLGVEAARAVGVTVTGAFDDAAASMLGGVVVTDNDEDELLARESIAHQVLVWTPPERSFSADADLERCRSLAPVADHLAQLALEDRYETAMTINGFAFCAALGVDPGPMLDAMPDATGVSLSGTGPSVVALGDPDTLEDVKVIWDEYEGTTTVTTTREEGAKTA